MKRIAGFLACLSIASRLGFGQYLPSVPYGGDWQYLRTPHFKILFQPGREDLANKTAILAELVHRKLSSFLRWQPADKTRIIILDNTDQANGLSTPFPRNTIIIYPALPHDQTEPYLEWLYELLLHEYTHILQTDMAPGLWGDLRQVFGRIILPNTVQPLLQIEGLAVYSESKFSSMGRNNSALTEGLLRTAAISKNWPSLDRAAVFNSCWPWDAPYLYGGGFAEFLADSFGESSLAEYQLRHARQLLFFAHRPAKKVFGSDFGKLWKNYTAKQSMIYRSQADSIRDGRFPFMSPATDNGFYKSSLVVSPDGERIVFYQSDGRRRPSLVMLDPNTGRRERMLECLVDGAIAFTSDGRSLVFGEWDYRRDGRELSGDLYRFDLESKRKTRLTHNLRARDPAPTPDGSLIYFVSARADQEALCRLRTETGAIDTIFAFADSAAFDCPRVSPQGGLLAFSARTGQGFQDIYVYDPGSGECRPLTLDRAQDLHPCWSRDGRDLYFCSDRSGVWNIYVYHTEDHSLQQLTQELGGAFWPQATDDRLWAIILTGKGYEIAWLDYPELKPQSPPDFQDRYFTWEVKESDDNIAGPQKYHPLSTLAPVAWLPAGFLDRDGFQTGAVVFGADDLMRHEYLASFAPNIKRKIGYYDIQYQCRAFPVDIGLNLYNFNILRSGADDNIYYEGKRGQVLNLSKTFPRAKRQTILGLGYSHSLTFDAGAGDTRSYPWWTGELAEVHVWLAYSDAQRYAFSISPERGRSLSLASYFYDEALGSDIEQIWLQAIWAEHLPGIWRHHVLMISAKAGRGLAPRSFLDEFSAQFKIRGWDQDVLGRTKMKATMEYRFPIKRVERGRGLWPFFLHAVHGALFAEAAGGERNYNKLFKGTWQRSVGLELRSDWTFFYGLRSQAKLGLARPLGQGTDYRFYLDLELPSGILHGKE